VAKDNTIYIRRNEDRQSPTHPEFKGNGVVDGKEYWANCWVNTGDDGKKYFSISLKPKEQKKVASKSAPTEEAPFDDDIPF
jgi:uncharacterized protein (DUF736 family)